MLKDPCKAEKTATRSDRIRYDLFKGLTFIGLSAMTLGLALNPEFAARFSLPGLDGGAGTELTVDETSPGDNDGLAGGLLGTDALVTITGQLINAVTGEALAGGEVCLQGTPQCAASNDDGYFTLGDLAVVGDATLVGSADGYFDTSVTVQPAAGETTTQNLTLSPVMTGEATRIVLTWNTERDYDSYLRVPSDGTDEALYIFHRALGEVDRHPFATLDVDDRNGLGPETITIDSRLSGTYAYIVHDYSQNRSLADATVRLYNASGLVAEFSGPTEPTDYWHVFNIDGDTGRVQPVNRLFESLPDPGL